MTVRHPQDFAAPFDGTAFRAGAFCMRPVAYAVACALLAGWAQAQNLPSHALPAGGRVVSGQATIGAPGGAQANRLEITQQSQGAAINWQSFNIGASASVNFHQPSASAVTVNRVTGQDPAVIMGNLTANGQVLILNPNGVLVGRGAQVTVGGLVASTLELSQQNLASGRLTLEAAGAKGSVVNQGIITAANGGYVALVGAQVRNEGTIQAPGGLVVLAAGDKATLTLDRNKLVGFSVDKGTLNALADNQGLIRAEGGRVLLTARAADEVVKAVVNNDGVIEATTVRNVGGVIRLLAEGGATVVAGKLDASAPHGGDGGFIETSGNRVTVAKSTVITTAAPMGKTGTWLIDPTDFTIAATGGDISGAVLGGQLAANDVVIASVAGAVNGNGDIFVNDNVTWASASSLTLNAQRHIDFSGGGILDGAAGTVKLNAGLAGTAGAIIAHNTKTVVNADALFVEALTGIGGGPTQPLRTHVRSAALINSKSGGISLINTGDFNVAAKSTGGDIDLRTAAGASDALGNAGGAITVTTIGALSGLTTAGSGDISLAAGAGGDADLFDAGAGGAINIKAPVSAQGAITLNAGTGGHAIEDVLFGISNNGGAGGAIAIDNTLKATNGVSLRAGDGGARDGIFSWGAAGAGGAISITAAIDAIGELSVRAGNGGTGGSAPTNGGAGGGIDVRAPLSATKGAVLEAGKGGDSAGVWADGGAGGFIGLYTALSLGADVSVSVGPGGLPGIFGIASGSGAVTGSAIDITAGGSLSIVGDIMPLGGAVSLRAGLAPGSLLDTSKSLILLSNPATDDLVLQGAKINPSVLYAANKLSISIGDGDIGSALAPQDISVNRLSVVANNIYLNNFQTVALDKLSSTSGKVYFNNNNNNITLAGPVSAGAAGDAIRLAGKNFANQAGAGALSAPNGRWIVWSDTPANNVFNGLQSGSNAVWNTAFDALSPTVPDAGNRFVFGVAPPTDAALIKPNDMVKTFGDTQSTFTFQTIAADAGAYYGNAFTDAGSTVTLSKAPALTSAGAVNTATRTGGILGGAGYDIDVDATGVAATIGGNAAAVQTARGLLTVAARPVTVTALDKTAGYGAAPAALTFTVDNLASFDTVNTAMTGALTRAVGANSSGGRESVGSYAIS